MATIVTREGKGSALSFAELDANFVNLNNAIVAGGGGGGGITFTEHTTDFTATVNTGIIANTDAGGWFNITLPSSPSIGDQIVVRLFNPYDNNPVTILKSNSHSFSPYTSSYSVVLTIPGTETTFTYYSSGASLYWLVSSKVPSSGDRYFINSNNNAIIGQNSNLFNNTYGSNNISIGGTNLDQNTTGSGNTALGAGALAINTVGSENIAIGNFSMYGNTTGSENIAIGSNSLAWGVDTRDNIAIGTTSLSRMIGNSTGFGDPIGSVAIGTNALMQSGQPFLASNITSPAEYVIFETGTSDFTSIGFSSNAPGTRLYTDQSITGTGKVYATVNNIAIGQNAMSDSYIGTESIAIGLNTLTVTQSTGIAIGTRALMYNTIGIDNIAIGNESLLYNTDGSNLSIGMRALRNNTIGSGNAAIGNDTLYNNTSGGYNLAIGSNSLQYNTTGTYNTGIGYFSLWSNTTSSNNVAIGPRTLASAAYSSASVAVGAFALESPGSISTSVSNIFIGSLYVIETVGSTDFTTIGGINTPGSSFQATGIGTGTGTVFPVLKNVAIGAYALTNNVFGDGNTAIGLNTLRQNYSGTFNTVVGESALYYNTTGYNNIAIGAQALFVNTTGSGNIALGSDSVKFNTSGIGNIGIGEGSLWSNQTGSYNIAIGEGALDDATGSGNICIGAVTAAQVSSPVYNITTENNRISIGSTAVTNAYIQVAWTIVSDARDKTNFASVPHGLDFVTKLNPIAYQFKNSREDDTPHGPVRYGFKAQDILEQEGSDPVIIDNEDPDKLRMNDTALIAVLVNAVKELKAELDKYKLTHP